MGCSLDAPEPPQSQCVPRDKQHVASAPREATMSSAELMEQKAPAAKPMAPPPNFPVQWEHPSDAGHFWMLDRMHTPDPITPLDQTFLEQVYAGMSAGAERYDL